MMSRKKVIIFDLDDTLYNEIEFLKSAYFQIAKEVSVKLGNNIDELYQEMLSLFFN